MTLAGDVRDRLVGICVARRTGNEVPQSLVQQFFSTEVDVDGNESEDDEDSEDDLERVWEKEADQAAEDEVDEESDAEEVGTDEDEDGVEELRSIYNEFQDYRRLPPYRMVVLKCD